MRKNESDETATSISKKKRDRGCAAHAYCHSIGEIFGTFVSTLNNGIAYVTDHQTTDHCFCVRERTANKKRLEYKLKHLNVSFRHEL